MNRESYFMRTPEKMAEVIECLDPFQEAGQMCWDRTSTERLAAFYTLTGALEYVAQTNKEVWERKTYLEVADLLQPLVSDLRKPFVEAEILRQVGPETVSAEGGR